MKTDADPHGWRIAGLVVALALALTATAHFIHTKVYCDPTHPSCIKTGPAPESHSAPSEGGAATEHAHPTDTTKKAEEHGKSGF